MATGVTQSPQTKPLLALKLSPSQSNLHRQTPAPSRSSSVAESFMTARTSATPALGASPTSSGTPSPRTPTSPSGTGASFLKEIDMWMENIGRLVTALEEQHRQRRFGVSPNRDADQDVGPNMKEFNQRDNADGLQPYGAPREATPQAQATK